MSADTGYQFVRADPLEATDRVQRFRLRPEAAKWVMIRFIPALRAERVAVAEIALLGKVGPPESAYAFKESPARAIDLSLAEAMIDWWGSAIERQADLAMPDERRELFQALAEAMRHEQADNPQSAAAAYWVAAALRGAGDPVNAWHAATAGWVRARLTGAGAADLRADLDKLVLQGIIPDRVRSLPSTDRAGAESQLRADWELIKERWR